MFAIKEFELELNRIYAPERFKDYGENGLQIEGSRNIKKVICGVTANQALIDKVNAIDADAIVVHHGLVWGGGIRSIRGWLGRRIQSILSNGVSLFAYHLPMDAHPTLGNNKGLCEALGLHSLEPFYESKGQKIGFKGSLPTPISQKDFFRRSAERLNPNAICCPGTSMIERVGVCTGGAPDGIHSAVDDGLDAYITGEISEYSQAIADETGVNFIAAGHHATEVFGPRLLADHLRSRLNLDAQFIDVPNPA